MGLDATAMATITAMAAVTYATRAGGYWLSGRFVFSRRVTAYLQAIPGAALTSLIAPAIVDGGWPFAVASAATLAVAVKTNSLLVAAATGATAVALLRATGAA